MRLVVGILQHAAFTGPAELLTIGTVLWATNVIAFALWFWHLDGGGPLTRASGTTSTRRAFVFPEQTLPELEVSGRYPQYFDYVALSCNTTMAFSPADVSAVRHRSKLMLILQAFISLSVLVLVVARAVNIL